LTMSTPKTKFPGFYQIDFNIFGIYIAVDRVPN